MIVCYPDRYLWQILPEFTPPPPPTTNSSFKVYRDLSHFLITPHSMVDMKVLDADNLFISPLRTSYHRKYFTLWV